MLNQFFEAIKTTVNHFWRWFFVQERKLSPYWQLPDEFLKWLEKNIDRFWQQFYLLETRFYSAALSWLTSRHKVLAWILIWLGINSLIIQGLYNNYQRKILSFQVTPVAQESAYRAALPIRISLPAIAVDLSIIEASIIDNIWQTSDIAVTHLSASARPGEKSNIVLYGHNRPELLNPLHQLQLGGEIIVETEAGVKHTYTVENIQIVSPNDIQYVLPTNEERLTLYTCTGFFDSQRLIVIATPSSVSSL